MDDFRIDRLTLKLSGLTEAEGRALGERVARGLAAADTHGIACTYRRAIRIDAKTPTDKDLDALSCRIVEEVLAQLRRSA